MVLSGTFQACHIDLCEPTAMGWHWHGVGELTNFLCSVIFPIFHHCQKHWLLIEYHVHIWQGSPQLSCGGTCKYEYDSKDPTGTFVRPKNSLTEKLMSGALVTTIKHQLRVLEWFCWKTMLLKTIFYFHSEQLVFVWHNVPDAGWYQSMRAALSDFSACHMMACLQTWNKTLHRAHVVSENELRALGFTAHSRVPD